jgi:hypothetical protein
MVDFWLRPRSAPASTTSEPCSLVPKSSTPTTTIRPRSLLLRWPRTPSSRAPGQRGARTPHLAFCERRQPRGQRREGCGQGSLYHPPPDAALLTQAFGTAARRSASLGTGPKRSCTRPVGTACQCCHQPLPAYRATTPWEAVGAWPIRDGDGARKCGWLVLETVGVAVGAGCRVHGRVPRLGWCPTGVFWVDAVAVVRSSVSSSGARVLCDARCSSGLDGRAHRSRARVARPGTGTVRLGPMWPDGPSCRATLGHRAQLAARARPYAESRRREPTTGAAEEQRGRGGG